MKIEHFLLSRDNVLDLRNIPSLYGKYSQFTKTIFFK